MAEALFRKMIEKDAAVKVFSAGLHAVEGLSASPLAVVVLAKQGIDLSSFRSQPVTPDLIKEAASVFAMTRDHLRQLLRLYPESQGKFFLLNAGNFEEDIPDPIGASMQTYQQCSETIKAALQKIIKTHILS